MNPSPMRHRDRIALTPALSRQREREKLPLSPGAVERAGVRGRRLARLLSLVADREDR